MTEPQARNLGHLIARARHRKGLTFEALSQETGYAMAWLHKLENGRAINPAPERLGVLSNLLDIDPARIDRVTSDHFADSLPDTRTYFRSKEKLSEKQLVEVEAVLNRLRRKYAKEAEQAAQTQQQDNTNSQKGGTP